MQFLYMARRDKYTIEVISTVDSLGHQAYKRNMQLHEIYLTNEQKFKLQNIYHPNRMDWELVVEESPDYKTLRENLKKRGFKFVPGSIQQHLPKSNKPFLS